MKRVAVTGANGVVGVAITPALAAFQVTKVDPRSDGLYEAFDQKDAVIHLGWIRVMGEPESGAEYIDVLPIDNRHLKNLELASAVIEAARQCGVRRVILASSVRADNFQAWRGPGLLSPSRLPTPIGPYGAAKVLLEEQGRFAASLGLEVICIRLGAITASDEPHPIDASERRVWLSHRDCGELIKTCLTAPAIPGGFCVVYAVSNNEGRVHDTGNPLGWLAEDGSDALAHATSLKEQNPKFGPLVKVSYTRLTDRTANDVALGSGVAKEHNAGFADRMLELLRKLADTPTAHPVSRFEHGLQTATRALRDGADEETIVCALFHDAADYFTTENHAAVVAELLRPYISPENHWMIAMHGEFIAGHGDKFRGHPCFERTVRFCERWDNESFDPNYDTLALETFEPMVRRILSRPAYKWVLDS